MAWASVIPSLSDRVVTDVMVDIPSLPIGSKYDRIQRFRPVNMQGYLIEMHVTPSVLLMGKLVDSNNKSKKYFRGFIHHQDTPSNKKRFITSRSGIFQASDLVPGEYVLTFGKKPYSPIKVTIPKNANGLYRLIDLQVNKLDSYSNDYEDESDLESQFNQEKVISDSASDSEENLLTLIK